MDNHEELSDLQSSLLRHCVNAPFWAARTYGGIMIVMEKLGIREGVAAALTSLIAMGYCRLNGVAGLQSYDVTLLGVQYARDHDLMLGLDTTASTHHNAP